LGGGHKGEFCKVDGSTLGGGADAEAPSVRKTTVFPVFLMATGKIELESHFLTHGKKFVRKAERPHQERGNLGAVAFPTPAITKNLVWFRSLRFVGEKRVFYVLKARGAALQVAKGIENLKWEKKGGWGNEVVELARTELPDRIFDEGKKRGWWLKGGDTRGQRGRRQKTKGKGGCEGGR